MSQKPLDVNALAGLIKKEEEREKKEKAAKIRSKVFPTEPRDFDTWFKLPVRFADCNQANDCIDPRVDKTKGGHTMVAVVNGSEICRYCFLAGANKTVE